MTRSEVTVRLKDGRELFAAHDSGIPDADLDRQTRRLVEKFEALAGRKLGRSHAGRVVDTVMAVDELADVGQLVDLLAPPAN